MKTPHLSIIVIMSITVMILTLLPDAFADVEKSVISVNDTQYEISISTVYSKVNSISTIFRSNLFNALDMNITSDKQYNDSLTLTLTKDASATIFCNIQRSPLSTPNWIVAVVDNYAEDPIISSTNDKLSITVGIPAGSKNVRIFAQLVGMGNGPQGYFKVIPQTGVYGPGQQVNLGGGIVDNCGRHFGIGTLQFAAKSFNVTKQITSDKYGRFIINFTIPENIESGIYNVTLDGEQQNLEDTTINLAVVPEFPFTIPILLISIILLVFYRFKFRMN